jgi:hypothetical protein
MTSPKIRMITVVHMVETRTTIFSSIRTNLVKRNVDIDAAAIFARLFPIKMVEKNSSGDSRIRDNKIAFLFFFLTLWASLIFSSESIEVSAEEKKALKMINMKNKEI